jgi:formylglycine-generating enzyme required for sulfatase activity
MGSTEEALRRYARSVPELAADPDVTDYFVSEGLADARRKVHVPGFWIDRYEVTNAEYARFLRATRRPAPPRWEGVASPRGLEQHPVVGISHPDALAYADWAGKKLPTDEQWVRAFRGDGDALLPWGDTWEPLRANVRQNDAFPGSSVVTATPNDVSPFGVYNLVGNVNEMMREPTWRNGKNEIVVRGAFWNSDGFRFGIASVPSHFEPEEVVSRSTGFRCVKETP